MASRRLTRRTLPYSVRFVFSATPVSPWVYMSSHHWLAILSFFFPFFFFFFHTYVRRSQRAFSISFFWYFRIPNVDTLLTHTEPGRCNHRTLGRYVPIALSFIGISLFRSMLFLFILFSSSLVIFSLFVVFFSFFFNSCLLRSVCVSFVSLLHYVELFNGPFYDFVRFCTDSRLV